METSQLLSIIHASEKLVLESFHGGDTTYANSSHSKEVSHSKTHFPDDSLRAAVQQALCKHVHRHACTSLRVNAIAKALAALQACGEISLLTLTTACGEINLLTKTAYQ